jgi:hypothetical protein
MTTLQYKLLAAGIILIGVYFKGRSDENAAWQKKMVAAEMQLHRSEAVADSLAGAIRTATAESAASTQQHISAVAVKIIERRQEFDRVPVPDAAVDLLNDSARGAR